MELHFGRAFAALAPSLLDGVGIVLYITIVGFLSSLVVGLVLAIGRLSHNRVLNVILIGFIEIIREPRYSSSSSISTTSFRC